MAAVFPCGLCVDEEKDLSKGWMCVGEGRGYIVVGAFLCGLCMRVKGEIYH